MLLEPRQETANTPYLDQVSLRSDPGLDFKQGSFHVNPSSWHHQIETITHQQARAAESYPQCT